MELTRKGKVAKAVSGCGQMRRKHNVPEWYLDSCKKIKYMFHKRTSSLFDCCHSSHVVQGISSALAFYATHFTVRGVILIMRLRWAESKLQSCIWKEVNARLREEKKAKDEDILASLQMVNEMLARGYEFAPIRIRKIRAKTYTIEDGKIRLPYMSMKGLGESVANALRRCLARSAIYLGR